MLSYSCRTDDQHAAAKAGCVLARCLLHCDRLTVAQAAAVHTLPPAACTCACASPDHSSCLQHCTCRSGFGLHLFANGTAACQPSAKPNTTLIVSLVIIGFLVALLASLGAWVWFYKFRGTHMAAYKRSGPPGEPRTWI